MHFVTINSSSPYMCVVKEYFENVISTLYGDQDRAIKKIMAGEDRTCDVLVHEGSVLGVIVYKNKLQGKRNSLEVKTLGLVNPKVDGRKGYGKQLITRVTEAAINKNAAGIKLTVSIKNTQSRAFFEHYNFKEEGRRSKNVGDEADEIFYRVKADTLKQIIFPNLCKSSSDKGNVKMPEQQEGKKESIGGCGKRPRGAGGSSEPIQNKRARQNDTRFDLSYKNKRESHERLDGNKPHGEAQRGVPITAPFYKKQRLQGAGASSSSAPTDDARNNHGLFYPPQPVKRTCTLMKKYVNLIRSGEKSYEARCNTSMFKAYKQGEHVKWFGGGSQVSTEILQVETFASFEEMLRKNGYKKYVPDARDLSHAIIIYNTIPGYREKARKHGVASFKLKIIEPVHTHQPQQQAKHW